MRTERARARAHGGASLKRYLGESAEGAQLPASPHDVAAWRRRAIRQP